ncbi:MAG: GNAT family N-acetyltransferase [Pseudomonadota bacterium]
MHWERFEEAYTNVIPARESFLHDGWLVRITDGDGNNNNSVWPLQQGTLPVESKVTFLEQVYRDRGHPPRFRITSQEEHSELNTVLEQRGYVLNNPNWVMVKDHVDSTPPNISLVPLDNWRDAVNAMNPEADIDEGWYQILSSIPVPHCFALLEPHGEPVAYGRGLVQQDILNLEELWTLPAHRGRGHGTLLMNGLLAFGRQHGAEQAFLAVNEDNHRATALYERFGFVKQYRYHYMVQHASS